MAKKLRRTIPRRILEHTNIVAVGALIYCKTTNRALFLLRDQDTYSGYWGLVGGRTEPGETILHCLARECREETGHRIIFEQVIPLELYQSNDNHFNYHTFICIVNQEFIPVLSHEHSGYAWSPVDNAPKPLHPGLFNSLNSEVIKNKLSEVSKILV